MADLSIRLLQSEGSHMLAQWHSLLGRMETTQIRSN